MVPVGSRDNGSSFSWSVDATIPISSFTFSGDFDLAACETIVDLEKSLPERTTGVLMDLSAVTFIDSTGLRMLIAIKHELRERNVRLFLGKMSPAVKKVMEISGVDGFFEFANGRPRSWWQGFKAARSRKNHAWLSRGG